MKNVSSVAMKYSKKSNDTIYQGVLLYRASRAYSKLAQYDKTIQTQLEAIRFYEKTNSAIGVAVMYNNMSIAYKYLGDNEDAIRVLKRALIYYKKAKMESNYFTPYLNIGDNYFRLGQNELALTYLDSSILMAKTYNETQPHLEGYVGYWKGMIAMDKGEYRKSLDFFEKSHQVRLEKYDIDDQTYTLLALGKVHLKLNNIQKSLQFLNQALPNAINAKADKRIMMSHEGLSEAYEKSGNYSKSLYHKKKQFEFRKKIFDNEKTMSIMSARTKFDVENKEREIYLLNIENKNAEQSKKIAEKNQKLSEAQLKQSKAQRMMLFFILGFVILGVIALVFILRNRSKVNAVLRTQKLEIEKAKHNLEEKNTEIMDSIQYAKRIQNAILPPLKSIASAFPKSFVLYEPKDIVAGDFYWMHKNEHGTFIAVADCTGHGVPGAMVSVICNNGLNRSVREFGLIDTGEILNKTRELVIQEFEKSEEEVKDGMDITLCKINGTNVQFSGAHNPLWIVKSGASEVEEIKADKQPIGKFASPTPYTSHDLELNQGDTIYLFSDGFPDQFGGPKGKKYKAKKFKNLLVELNDTDTSKQLEPIINEFNSWKGNLEQLDDVCVIGIQL